jgi:CheY-like chemotaxis protein
MPHRHHVLLVEDHDDVREVLETALDLLGAGVSAFGDARDALAALREGLDPCVVLLDWRMPEMDGEAFLRARMHDAPLVGTPVVVVTGDGLRSERAMKLGIREVVRKPIDPADVFAAVERHCPKTHESD